jgi:two-component system NtrC family sensor kinase
MSTPDTHLLIENRRLTPPTPPPANIILTTAVLIILTFTTYLISQRFVFAYAALQVSLLAYFIAMGRRFPQVWTSGWPLILIGFNLLTFGSVIEVSTYIPFLRTPLLTHNDAFRNFLKQVVGNNSGFLVLAFGFYRWVPSFLASRTVMEELVKKYEAQLIRNEKLNALAGLVSGVAHELNNPLSIVIGYTGLLSRNTDPQFAQKALAEIERAAHRCKKVANNLLVFARQPLPARTPIDMVEILEASIQLLEYQFRVEGITVERNFPDGPARTVADPDQLLQVFFNLLNNARQALAGFNGPRQITVRCRVASSILVEIIDTGPGIDPAHLSQIFQPFFTTKRAGEGTGLGLSICFGILKAHAAEIRVTSEPRVRTAFTCEFPITEQADVAAALPATGTPVDLSGKCLLLVDDDDGVLDFYRSYAAVTKAKVEYSRTGEDAQARIDAHRFDLIIMDLKMPDKGGREVYQWLKEKHPEALPHLVFVTGDTADPKTMEFLNDSGRPYLFKPFTSSSFDELLATHVR